jgi:glutaredoxin
VATPAVRIAKLGNPDYGGTRRRTPFLLPLFARIRALAHENYTMVWDWLTGRRPRSGPPAEIVLYTRQGCHLCDDARTVLESAGQRHALVLRTVDVDTDPDLVARYGLEVPVVMIDGRVRFRGRVNRVLLERLLARRK